MKASSQRKRPTCGLAVVLALAPSKTPVFRRKTDGLVLPEPGKQGVKAGRASSGHRARRGAALTPCAVLACPCSRSASGGGNVGARAGLHRPRFQAPAPFPPSAVVPEAKLPCARARLWPRLSSAFNRRPGRKAPDVWRDHVPERGIFQTAGPCFGTPRFWGE